MIGSGKPLLRLKRRTLSPKQQLLHNFRLGQHGEHAATEFLLKHHFQVLETNFCYLNHEIDVVVFDPQTREVVFIEVKTRQDSFYGSPSAAVDYRKLRSLRQAAHAYLKAKKLAHDYRFDIITVLPNSIEHYQNITW